MSEIFFFQNSAVYYLFFYIFSFWHFLFNFIYLYWSKNSGNFNVFFILWIRDFIKDFWKIMEHFSKKYRHLKSKILHKFHYLLFVFFILLAFLTSFFRISPMQTCHKILNIFVVLYYMGYRFYHRILENSWILI